MRNTPLGFVLIALLYHLLCNFAFNDDYTYVNGKFRELTSSHPDLDSRYPLRQEKEANTPWQAGEPVKTSVQQLETYSEGDMSDGEL